MSHRNVVFLLVFSLVLGIFLNWGRDFTGRDETRVAGIAREMAISGDFLVPRLNGETFSEYPPIGYWLPALLFSLTNSSNAFPIHLSGVLFCIATVFLTFQIGKMIGGERIGLCAGIFIQLSVLFLNLERTLIVDTPLLFFLTLSVFGLCNFFQAQEWNKQNWKFTAYFYLGMAGAFLTKGLLGLGIPVLVAIAWLGFQKNIRWLCRLFLSPSILFLLLPILVWAGSLWASGQSSVLLEVFTQSLNRFGSAEVDHIHGSFFYFGPLFYNFFPGTLLFLVLLWLRFGPSKQKELFHFPQGFTFAWIWFLSIFLLLVFSLSKRVLYLAPLLPAFSLMAAFAWEKLQKFMQWKESLERTSLVGLSMIMISAHFLIFMPRENEDSFRPFFEAVKQLGTQRELVLYQASERLRGATVLYLAQTLPVARSQMELDALLRTDTKPKLLLFSSSKKDDLQAGDFSDSLVFLMERTVMKERIRIYSWN